MDGERPRLSSARSLTLVSVRAAIEARLTDSALDAGTVAAVAGISVRYANDVLAKNETSIVRLVQARRLERSRRALQDRSQTHRTVSEIAYGWGFSDMTHFGLPAQRVPQAREMRLSGRHLRHCLPDLRGQQTTSSRSRVISRSPISRIRYGPRRELYPAASAARLRR
jgi:AraC-like DNA-binding protein